MKAFMKKTTALLFIVTIIMIGIYIVSKIDVFKTLAITFAVTFYHFSMRLLIGFIYQQNRNHNFSWKSKWFQVSIIETQIYKIIKVKHWKKYMPTYDSSSFDVKNKSLEQIIKAMCQAEVVHETIIVFSFVPILASVWFGAIEVFTITSCVSAFIDLTFVIIQRYNRPRVLMLLRARSNR